jgi:putative membrane protein
LISLAILEHNKPKVILLLLVLHVVGVFGFFSPYKSLFVALTPLNLMLSLVLVILSQGKINAHQKLWLVSAFLIGFLVEVIGVNTGWVFGNYYYTDVLGFSLFGVPLLIGLNWFMVSYGSYSFVANLKVKPIIKVLIASVLCVVLDYFLEPVAIELNYWVWLDGTPPIQNFIAWFLLACCIQSIAYYGNRAQVLKPNKVAAALFIIQFLFFLFLKFLI